MSHIKIVLTDDVLENEKNANSNKKVKGGTDEEAVVDNSVG